MGLIVYGLKLWINILPCSQRCYGDEVYGKQFDWTVRYAGGDNVRGILISSFDYMKINWVLIRRIKWKRR